MIIISDNIYTEDSIESLDPREHIQLRSGMYIGSNENPNQLLMEIFSNALDEYNIGHGKNIYVSISKNGICRVRDEAQGFPVNVVRPEDGKTILEASFGVINTSGKYRDDGVYEGSSLGLNGVGGKVSNFLSTYFSVCSHRDGKYETLLFKEGLLESREVGKWEDLTSGTDIEYLPDPKYFQSNITDAKYFEKFFEDICCMCPGLTIRLTTDNSDKIIKKNGINDLVGSRVGSNVEIINNRFILENKDISLGMTFTSSNNSTILSYVNLGETDSGPHITSLKSSITRILNSWAKENGLLKEKEKNLDGSSIQEGMLLVCNISSTGVTYDSQTKSRVVSLDSNFIDEFNKQFEVWLDNNPEDSKIIIEKALLARKASEAAKKAREAVKNKKRVANKVKILNPDKLKDAEYLGEDSTLLVVEGLSAGASMAVARDVTKYGILMLRGKLINAFTNKDEKLLQNEEIQLLFKALNINPNERYNPSKLRYGKIAICVDSDSDGHHIALLIMSALQHFCPQFIEEKRLCWLRSPLYIVKNKGKEDYYFTDKEMNEARSSINGEVQRNKGLGSLSAEQARASMFGKNQHMDILAPTWNAIELLEKLMGSEVAYRKDYIFNNIDFSEVKE